MPAFAPHVTDQVELDILYVSPNDAPVAQTRELDLWRNVDLAADGTVVGIEFVNASGGIHLADVSRANEVAGLVRDFNLPVVAR